MADHPQESFEFVGALHVRAVLADYYDQAVKALLAGSHLGAVVGFGAVVEGLLTWALKQRQSEARATAAAKKAKCQMSPIEDWKLYVLVDAARDVGIIVEAEHAIREWRNLIHPYRRIRSSIRFDEATALSALRSVGRIIQILGGEAESVEVSPQEMKFTWLVDAKLAGCRGPANEDDLRFLRSTGIQAIVRLVAPKDAHITVAQIAAAGLQDLHEPVRDFCAPSPLQLQKILQFIEANTNQGKPVVVSCGAGYGRTGTVLACFLITQGLSAGDSLSRLEKVRPYSVDEIRSDPSHRQLDFITAFAQTSKPRRAQRLTRGT